MAIDAYGNTLTSSTTTSTTTSAAVDKSALGKDDFLKLLLLELKYQDPTAPMDSEKILTQTSQLATLESAENTNKALETLASSLTSSMQYQGISAIGKMADTGSNAILKEDGATTTDFEIYFPDNVSGGDVNILDNNGNILRSIAIGATDAGVAKFSWDGKDDSGTELDAGIYYAESSYTKTDGTAGTARVGIYPIESIKFDSGTTYAKLGSGYVDFSSIKEITGS